MTAAADAKRTKTAQEKKVNRADEIRKALLAYPAYKNKEIVEYLAKKGIKAPPSQVSNEKKKLLSGSSARTRNTEVPATVTEVLAILAKAGGLGAVEKAVRAVEAAAESQALLDSLGGAKSAKEIVAQLKTLTSK